MLNDAQIPASRTRIAEPDFTPSRVWFRFFESLYQYISKAFGMFHTTVTQTASANTPTAVEFSTTGSSRSIAVGTDTTKITVSREGVYSVQTGVQFINTTMHVDNVVVWLKVNGLDVGYSARWATIDIKRGSVNDKVSLVTENLLYLYPRDYVQVYWMSTGGHVEVGTIAASASPLYPATPGVVVVMDQVV